MSGWRTLSIATLGLFANGKDRHLVTDAYYDQFFTGGEKAPTPTP
jgi:hypothetical protein